MSSGCKSGGYKLRSKKRVAQSSAMHRVRKAEESAGNIFETSKKKSFKKGRPREGSTSAELQDMKDWLLTSLGRVRQDNVSRMRDEVRRHK